MLIMVALFTLAPPIVLLDLVPTILLCHTAAVVATSTRAVVGTKKTFCSCQSYWVD